MSIDASKTMNNPKNEGIENLITEHPASEMEMSSNNNIQNRNAHTDIESLDASLNAPVQPRYTFALYLRESCDYCWFIKSKRCWFITSILMMIVGTIAIISGILLSTNIRGVCPDSVDVQ
eukprot:371905_1